MRAPVVLRRSARGSAATDATGRAPRFRTGAADCASAVASVKTAGATQRNQSKSLFIPNTSATHSTTALSESPRRRDAAWMGSEGLHGSASGDAGGARCLARTRRTLDSRPHANPLRRRSQDRKSTRLNSSHLGITYAVFCLKKKNKKQTKCTNQGITEHEQKHCVADRVNVQ